MTKTLLIVLGTQALYSLTDFMGRAHMSRHGFTAAAFLSWWFVLYQVVRQVAMFGHLYLFAHVPLGKMMALLAAMSILLSNLLGWLLLGEVLSGPTYAGISLAIAALLVMMLG